MSEPRKDGLKFEESCLNCKYWEERAHSNRNSPPRAREGICRGKFDGDFVTANQYCLGFLKR